MQLGEVTGGDVNTLHFDGTNKHEIKYTGFQVTTDEEQFTLTVNKAFTGSAEHTMEILKRTIDQISSAGEKLGRTKAGEKLLCSLKNTMTDRAAVNTKFHDLLSTYRADVLPILHEKWDALHAEQQAETCRLNNYFCALHLLVSLVEQCGSILKESDEPVG